MMKVKDMGKSWGDGLLLINLASVLMRLSFCFVGEKKKSEKKEKEKKKGKIKVKVT